MARTQEQENNKALVMNVLYVNGAMASQAMKTASGLTQAQILPVVQEGLADGWLGQDGNTFGLSEEGITEYETNYAQLFEETAEEEAQPAPVAQAPAKIAARPAAAKAAAAPVAQRPAARPAPAPAPAKAAAKPAAKAAAKAAQPEGFTMTYKRMDTLTPAELEERVAVGREAAEANAQAGQLIVAELVMRTVARMERRLGRK